MAAKRTLATFEKTYTKTPEGQERISQLRKQLANISAAAPAVTIPTDNEITFAAVSCSHIGSLYSNLSGLQQF